MRRKWVALLMTGSLLTGAGGTYGYLHFAGALAAESKVELHTESNDEGTPQTINLEELDKVEKAYELILNSYVESVDQEKLIEGAIQGMLTTLDDPYSVYMDKETAKQFSSTLESRMFCGLRSRWTRPCAWACWSARAIFTRRRAFSSSGRSFIAASKDRPSM